MNKLYMYDRIYQLLKFAGKQDQISIVSEKLEGNPDKEAILKYLEPLSEKNYARATAFIIRTIKESNSCSLQDIINFFEGEKENKSQPRKPQATIITDSLSKSEKADLDIVISNNNFKKWIIDRFSDAKSKNEIHPLKDCLPTLISYQQSYQKIAQSYLGQTETNLKFKEMIDNQFPDRRWNTPADILNLSIDDMVSILDIFYGQNKTHRYSDKLPTEDLIGKVGEWNLWLPSSRENSIRITLNLESKTPKTTWCTSRTEGSNLFYNYIGGTDGNLLLFYLIKDNPSKDNDWLSLGFKSDSPIFNGSGGVSVDRANNGLTDAQLQTILGQNYSEIMNILSKKSEDLDGISPALKKINEAATDLRKYNELIKGNEKDEKSVIDKKIAENPNLTQEVQLELAEDSESFVRLRLAENPNLTPKAQLELAKDSKYFVRYHLAGNPNLTPKAQLELAKDSKSFVRLNLAGNPNLTQEVQLELAEDREPFVRSRLAENPNLTPKSQLKLAENPNLTQEAKLELRAYYKASKTLNINRIFKLSQIYYNLSIK